MSALFRETPLPDGGLRLDVRLTRMTIRHVAYHEAGHAVAQLALGGAVERVEIHDAPGIVDAEGRRFRGRIWTETPLEPRNAAVMLLAGTLAECRARRIGKVDALHLFSIRNGSDYDQFIEAARALKGNPPKIGLWFFHLLEEAANQAHRLLDEHRPGVCAIAHALIRRRRLTGDEAAAIFAEARP